MGLRSALASKKSTLEKTQVSLSTALEKTKSDLLTNLDGEVAALLEQISAIEATVARDRVTFGGDLGQLLNDLDSVKKSMAASIAELIAASEATEAKLDEAIAYSHSSIASLERETAAIEARSTI